MAARKKKARRKTAKKKAARRKPARRKPARLRGGKKRATKKAASRKAGGKRKAAKKKAAKKKTGKKSPKRAPVAHVITVSGGKAYPSTLKARSGDTFQWENEDAADYEIHFDSSPFRPASKPQDIPLAAGTTTAAYKARKAKEKVSYGYDIRGSKAESPPGEPQVTIDS